MGNIQNNNFDIRANKHIDGRYLNINVPWVSVSEVNTNIPQSYRYTGLTVNISGLEYWYSEGILDIYLVEKRNSSIVEVTNGINLSGGKISLGGILTGDTIIAGTGSNFHLKYDEDYSSRFDNRSIVDREYVDNVASGVKPKQAVMVSTTEDIALDNLIVIDDYQLVDGDRVLVKDQNNAIENGLYVATTGAWTRSTDFDNTPSGEVVSGTYMYVLTGTTNGNYAYVLTTEDPVDIGVSGLTFVIFNQNQTINGGIGITTNLVGRVNNISIDGASLSGNNIEWTSNSFNLDSQTINIINNSISGGTNGICNSNGLVALGGDLTENTFINLPYASQTTLVIGNGTGTAWFGGRVSTVRDNVTAANNKALIGARSDTNNSSLITASAVSGIEQIINIGGVNRSAILGLNGYIYGACYHSCYTNRSLVDKEYVDSAAGGVGGSNGLSRVGDNITLGGSLSGNTVISGEYGLTYGISGTGLTSYNIYATTLLTEFNSAVYNDISGTPSGITYAACYHSTYSNRSLVDKEYVDSSISSSTGTTVFGSDIEVSLSTGKSFGRYCCGDIIPANGKTPAEVILMSVVEPLEPTVTMSSFSNVLTFGQASKSVNLNLSYVINSLNATVSSVILEYKRGGGWSTLLTTTGSTVYLHNINDTGDRFNTTLIEYRYTVVDTLGATGVTTLNVAPTAYVAPTISPIYTGTLLSYESQTLRESGNINTTITGNITSNNTLVNLTDYRIYRDDGGGYSEIVSEVGINALTKVISSFLDTDGNPAATSIKYKIEVDDEFATTTSSIYTITYRFSRYFGFSSSNPLTAGQILSLGNQVLTTSLVGSYSNVTAPSSNYTYYSYPALYGDLSNVILDGVTPILGAFTQLTDVSVTNNYGQIITNSVYVSNAVQAFDNNSLSFI